MSVHRTWGHQVTMLGRIAQVAGNIALWAMLVGLIAVFSASLAVTWMQRDLMTVHQQLSHSLDEIQFEIASKVDETTRQIATKAHDEQVAAIEVHLHDIEEHLRAVDVKMDLLWQERHDAMVLRRRSGE
jgi:hypothetical protein